MTDEPSQPPAKPKPVPPETASPVLGRVYEETYDESFVDFHLPRTGRGLHIDDDRDDDPPSEPVTEYGPPAYWDRRGPDTYGQDWKAEVRRIVREELDRKFGTR